MRGKRGCMPHQTASHSLNRSLKPLCSRHDHLMAYEEKGIQWSEESDSGKSLQTVASYHCGYFGCSVRYSASEGYFTVIDTPDRPHFVEEPGANIFRCTRHGGWLYRSSGEGEDKSVR